MGILTLDGSHGEAGGTPSSAERHRICSRHRGECQDISIGSGTSQDLTLPQRPTRMDASPNADNKKRSNCAVAE